MLAQTFSRRVGQACQAIERQPSFALAQTLSRCVGQACQAIETEMGRAVVRPVLPLSLTFDHRVVTGAEAARFLGAVRRSLEQPSLEEEQP